MTMTTRLPIMKVTRTTHFVLLYYTVYYIYKTKNELYIKVVSIVSIKQA